MTDPTFVPTHRTPQGLVKAVQWFKTGDHPLVRALEELDRRRLRRQNLPAHDAHVNGSLEVGFLDKIDNFVFPGQWIWTDERGDVHLRDSEVHDAHAQPWGEAHEGGLNPAASTGGEADRPQRAGTVERNEALNKPAASGKKE